MKGSEAFTFFVPRTEDEPQLTNEIAFAVESLSPSYIKTRVWMPGNEEEDGKEEGGEDDAEEEALIAQFLFDNDHVWLEKRVGRKWWLIDSRSDGPRQIKQLTRNANHGHVLVYQKAK